jgi:DNA-binding MarR family transcriptional regulator
MAEWAFISNHGLILAYIAQNPRSTAREIAQAVNVTEWTVHRIISDLEKEGYLQRTREGRNNVYTINHELRLRHKITHRVPVRNFLKLLGIQMK